MPVVIVIIMFSTPSRWMQRKNNSKLKHFLIMSSDMQNSVLEIVKLFENLYLTCLQSIDHLI